MKNIGRNDPCPCNSGKKYKKCCGQQEIRTANPTTEAITLPNAIHAALEHHQAGRLAQAEAIYRQILQVEPDQPDVLHFLGVLAYQVGNIASAIELYRKVLNLKPDYAEAYYNLGLALHAQAQLDDAVASYQQALGYQPNYAEAHNNLGAVLYDQGKLDEALASYRQALKLRPHYAEALNNQGNALKNQGNLVKAIASYRLALRYQPNYAEAHYNLGNAFKEQGELDKAVASYQQALVSKPDYAQAYNDLGNALQAAGKLAEAVASYRQALAIQPNSAETYHNLGNALKEQGELDKAVASYRQALAIQPNSAVTQFSLGNALKEQGEPDKAAASYRQALAIQPDYVDAYNNLGNALQENGRLVEAVANFKKALALKPDYAETHFNLANTLKKQGELDKAVASYRQALTIKPDYVDAYNNLGVALNDQGKLDDAITCYRQAFMLKPDFTDAHCNLLFCLNYHPDMSAEAIFAEYRRWNERHARPLLPHPTTHANDRDPKRRLRIGYVSPDMRMHSTRHFLEPLLDHHDKSQVEVYAYAQVAVEDDVSAQLRHYTDHWTNTVGIGDDKLADMIRQDGIDILVDLAGHTAKNRLLVFARKPAPIQVSWMGYGYTTGMDAMDYFLSDREFTPQGCEALFSEKLVRLPVAGVYRPGQGMGEPGPLPALQKDIITLGSLSRSIRINHRVVRTWAAILHRLPNARLMINSVNFRTADMQRSIQIQFSTYGIAANRLVLGYESPPWDALRQIDISLDCFPHNSGATLWESLYMGIPVVTLAGRPSVGRSGSAALMKINHPEWIATSEQEYVEKAVVLASDLDALAALRAELRSQMQSSLLMDEPAFVRSLETAYRTLWQRWCDGLPPANIEE